MTAFPPPFQRPLGPSMAISTYDKAVKGATKVKVAAPKTKWVEPLLAATHSGDGVMGEVFRCLASRLRDSTWSIVFKSLIVVHVLIREGYKDAALQNLVQNPSMLSCSHFTDASEQGYNIKRYSYYLSERVKAYESFKVDHVRERQHASVEESRLRKLSVDQGLLREVQGVQREVKALLKCDFYEGQSGAGTNEITITAFRLLVSDLLTLFKTLNEGVINVLEHYFEMSRQDAERALDCYKTFTKLTSGVVEYLKVARRLETSTRLQIPNIKHAPTSLTKALEEYLDDPEFEKNRRQYLAQKQEGSVSPAKMSVLAVTKTQPSSKAAEADPHPTNSGPAKQEKMIDFFESIEREQMPMFTSPTPSQSQFQQTPSLPSGQVSNQQQPQYGQEQNGFSGYYGQPYQQQQPQYFVPPTDFGSQATYMNSAPQFASQSLNPYPTYSTYPPQSMEPQFTGAGFGGYSPPTTSSVTPPASLMQQVGSQQPSYAAFPSQSPPTQTQPQMAQPTGTNPFRQSMIVTGPRESTNPFRKSLSRASTIAYGEQGMQSPPIPQQATGSNPFRQSMMSPQRSATYGGLEHLETIPVFPRH